MAAYWPTLYPKFEKVPVRITNEQKAIADVLAGETDTTKDVAALKSELTSLHERMNDLAASKERAERLFEEAVKEKTELTASSDASAKKLAEDLGGRIRQLESRIREQEELLHNRESAFQQQFTDVASSKERAARALHEDLKRKTQLLDDKEVEVQPSNLGTSDIVEDKTIYAAQHTCNLLRILNSGCDNDDTRCNRCARPRSGCGTARNLRSWA